MDGWMDSRARRRERKQTETIFHVPWLQQLQLSETLTNNEYEVVGWTHPWHGVSRHQNHIPDPSRGGRIRTPWLSHWELIGTQ
jgi:hypothetical protein